MKRLIFSDIHLHPWGYASTTTESGFNSRLMAQYRAACEMIEDIDKFNIKYAYFTGDLFHQHSNISTQALVVASNIFKKLRSKGVKIRAIAGNHDQYTKSGLINALEFLPEEEINGHWNDGGLEVLGLSYTNNEEYLKRFLDEASKRNYKMILLHSGVAGTPLSSGYVLDDKLTSSMIPDNVRAFTGHYHFFREVSSNLTVVGNLAPINWGDIDQKKGWLIWDDETNELEQRIQTTAPNFISYDVNENLDSSLIKNNFVRYIQPINAKDQSEIRTNLIEKGALAVEFPTIKINEKQTNISIGEKVTIDLMVKKFEDRCEGRRKEVGKEIRNNEYRILSS